MPNFNPTISKIDAGSVHPTKAVSTIDKLSAVTNQTLDLKKLKAKAEKVERGFGYFIELPKPQGILWFAENRFDGVVNFSLTPSRQGNSEKTFEVIEQHFGEQGLLAEIVRCDCAITLPIEFDELAIGLDFGPKRFVEKYRNTQSGRSWYVGRRGRRNELIVYDKKKEHKAKGKSEIKHPCTRIEINSVPIGGLKVSEIGRITEHEPFKHLTRYQVEFNEPKTQSLVTWRRFLDFKARTLREGFWETKRQLNRECNRNFKRLYGDFYELEELKPSLDEIFQIGIRGFFSQ